MDSRGRIAGFGTEFVKRVLARGDWVAATVRQPSLEQATATCSDCEVYACDMLSELTIDRPLEIFYSNFALNLNTNSISAVICAQRLLQTFSTGIVMFNFKDSGLLQNFREMEDGLAPYASSEAALNQILRHLAAGRERKGRQKSSSLYHGEVKTDMVNLELAWEVEGEMTPQQSISA